MQATTLPTHNQTTKPNFFKKAFDARPKCYIYRDPIDVYSGSSELWISQL